jgi:argininosuccinate synthase
MALDPSLKIIAPWKDVKFELRDRESAVEYAQKHNVPIPVSKEKIYSQDRNLWHISHEGAEIEHPDKEPNWEKCLTMVSPLSRTPNESEVVEVGFDSGNPTSLNGAKLSAEKLIAELNKVGGKHGVGVALLVENRLIGMKSRGVYETPGGTILYEAHKALEQICIERDTLHYKQQIALRYAELVYNGQWFHPLREALQTFIDHTNATVTGTARVRLFKGRAQAIGATSPNTLYDPQLASFSMEGYDVTAARGFIDLFGLPMKVRGLRQGGGDVDNGRTSTKAARTKKR